MSPPSRQHGALLPLIALALTIALSAFVLTRPLEIVVDDIADDGFFFLRIAQFFAEGKGFSFDGYTETYGFQPFWQMLCIGLRACVGDDPRLLLQAALVLCTLLHVATGYVLARVAEALGRGLVPLVVLLLWSANPSLFLWSLGLKENALYAALFALALLRFRGILLGRGRGAGEDGALALRSSVFFGALLGLMVLNRVNALITAGIFIGLLFVAGGASARAALGAAWGRRRLQHALSACAGLVLLAAPWYLFAYAYFGSALPTSGVSKFYISKAHVEGVWQEAWLSPGHVLRGLREMPEQLWSSLQHAFGAATMSVVALTCLGVVCALAMRIRRGDGGSEDPGHAAADAVGAPSSMFWMTSVAVLSALAGCLANVMFLAPFLAYARWYTVPEYVAVFVVVALALAALARALRRMPRVVAPLALVAAALPFAWRPLPVLASPFVSEADYYTRAPRKNQQLLEFGLWAARAMPDDQRAGIWDPGIVSYFSQRGLTSLDPLMNSLEYQTRDILDQVAYCKREGIRYVFGSTIRLPDGRLTYRYLMPGTNRVVWQPWPEHSLGWAETDPWWTVVRLEGQDADADFERAGFGFGRVAAAAGTELVRSPGVTRRVRELRAGMRFDADVLRIRAGSARTGLALVTPDGREALAFGEDSWLRLDLRARRGQTLRLEGSDEALEQIVDLQIVDYSFPAKR